MTFERKWVRFCDERELSLLFRYNPWTAATTLPAAIMEGGHAIKLTSERKKQLLLVHTWTMKHKKTIELQYN